MISMMSNMISLEKIEIKKVFIVVDGISVNENNKKVHIIMDHIYI
jgi:hypothetical protein